jgi:hypothetical protein
VADVGAQVDFGEVPVCGDRSAEDARVEEPEGDEADVGRAVPQVGLEGRVQVLCERVGRDGVRDEEEVGPAGGEEVDRQVTGR